ncbi:ABC-three component system middle component 2 [Streptomyces griseoluteus]|uniref:ABC-three component system middle component 2 n=1 Tax=Streptomyces griseoluteus TaxID=29306 RepID=UPI0036A0FB22
MSGAGLADVEADETGLVYRATERGPAFVDTLEAPYVERLRERAEWAVHHWAPTPTYARPPRNS